VFEIESGEINKKPGKPREPAFLAFLWFLQNIQGFILIDPQSCLSPGKIRTEKFIVTFYAFHLCFDLRHIFQIVCSGADIF
jgi:hypothetical protein